MGSKKPAGQVDHFHRLPEEVLLYIFSKLTDLKSLCQCSLVSKRFASVISHTRTIYVTLHGAHSSVKQTAALLELLSLQELKLLKNFKELESIYVEYTYPKEIDSPSFLKWKIKCTSSNAFIGSFICLSASVHKMIKHEPDDEQETRQISTEFMRLSYRRYMEWLFLIFELAKSHASLKSVRIEDSEKTANLVVRDEQIVKTRSCVLEKELPDVNGIRSLLKIAWVPELRLPLSGYLMRGVGLTIIKPPTEEQGGNVNNHDDITFWDFEDEEKVFAEAVKEILINHRDKIIGD
ncbi:hypothetical protein ACJIZ3_012067 [Penstemon smallii]|uniref:F-box domain-containing protein n=1 Tax=Penstemon smallii TaxID=265156 RepID=A0ABD3UM96_9LAMI